MRIGYGYDTHRFAEGRPLILGGIEIPFERGLSGHSDADVLLHAICDALLGAAALGDIGQHFPDTDPAYQGADSAELLQKTAELVGQAGFKICNVDATIVLERPRLGKRTTEMKARIAGLLGLAEQRVSVKATTSEGMGFVGREEGVAAHAVCLISREEQDG